MWDSRRPGSGPRSGKPARPGSAAREDGGSDAGAVSQTPGRLGEVSADVTGDALVIKPDPGFLADPATVYPVTVDPTTTLGVTAETSIGDDGAVYSTAGTLQTGRLVMSTATGEKELYRSYLGFDTSFLNGATVSSASLRLQNDYASDCRSTPQIAVKRVTGPWRPLGADDPDGDVTDWDSQPESTWSGYALNQGCASGAAWTWDVTTIARAWAAGEPGHGLLLLLDEELPKTLPDYIADFHSSTRPGGTPPKLTLTYTAGTSTPTPTPTGGAAQTLRLPLSADAGVNNWGYDGDDDALLAVGTYDFTTMDRADLSRAYLKFDTAALAGKTVMDAKLTLTSASGYGCGTATQGIRARQVTGDWSSGSLGFGSEPATTDQGATLQDAPGTCTAEGEVTWSIKQIVQAWADGAANHGVQLAGHPESGIMYERYFASSRSTDSGAAPTLTVTVASNTPTPTPTVTPSTTPTATPTVTPIPGTGSGASNETTLTLAPVSDTTVESVGNSYDTPDEDVLIVGGESVSVNGEYKVNYSRSYLKFDVSALAGKQVLDARLELHNNETWCHPNYPGVYLSRVTEDWTAGRMT
ncbi:DNRLRE domain-containing protein [Planomonospora corallina]|uniref:DNRLRE domain-containing protein n=1 Tax=Planomonospora corallina TaxID=1806052 RepID=A0ABV8I9J7_9ACTN